MEEWNNQGWDIAGCQLQPGSQIAASSCRKPLPRGACLCEQSFLLTCIWGLNPQHSPQSSPKASPCEATRNCGSHSRRAAGEISSCTATLGFFRHWKGKNRKRHIHALEHAAANAAYDPGSLIAWKGPKTTAVSGGQVSHCKNISKSSNGTLCFR